MEWTASIKDRALPSQIPKCKTCHRQRAIMVCKDCFPAQYRAELERELQNTVFAYVMFAMAVQASTLAVVGYLAYSAGQYEGRWGIPDGLNAWPLKLGLPALVGISVSLVLLTIKVAIDRLIDHVCDAD